MGGNLTVTPIPAAWEELGVRSLSLMERQRHRIGRGELADGPHAPDPLTYPSKLQTNLTQALPEGHQWLSEESPYPLIS